MFQKKKTEKTEIGTAAFLRCGNSDHKTAPKSRQFYRPMEIHTTNIHIFQLKRKIQGVMYRKYIDI